MNYSLVRDPWIPVVDLAGNHSVTGLRLLFTEAHKIGAVGGTPSQHIALMRLLVAISQASVDGPADNQHWLKCLNEIQPAAEAYLDRYKDHFYLFGERAFLQIPDLGNERCVPVDALDYCCAVDSRTTWRDNHAEGGPRARSAAWAALSLLAHQSFAAPGLIASGLFNGATTGRSATAGPAIAGAPLHSLLIGSSLLHTIWLNMVPFDRLKPMEPGRPVWERPPFDPESADIHANGYLGRLVPMSRGISFLQDSSNGGSVLKMSRIEAVRFPGLPTGREPWASVIEYKRKDEDAELGYVTFRPDRHPWRYLGSVLQLQQAKSFGVSPPLQLPNILLLSVPQNNHQQDLVTLWTGGMAYDPSNAAKLLGQGQWLFSVPLQMLGDAALAVYSQGVSIADNVARGLRKAVRAYEETLAAQAVSSFWHSCAVNHPLLISTAANLQPLDKWQRKVVGLALKHHETSCRPSTAVQWKRFFQGQSIIKKGAI